MVGSKAYCFTAIWEVVVADAAQATINQPPPPPSQRVASLEAKVSLHPNLVHAPAITGSAWMPLIGHLILPTTSQLEALPSFHLLWANIGLQDANELMNKMYNIIRE